MAKIQLNGKSYEVNPNTNLTQLLRKLNISSSRVAIEINGVIAEKSKYHARNLNAGDKVEIVHFIGGG
tara:strand:- start:427 stop:630 length:204 start_codon:yes stop_codon:yes gene_type:complete